MYLIFLQISNSLLLSCLEIISMNEIKNSQGIALFSVFLFFLPKCSGKCFGLLEHLKTRWSMVFQFIITPQRYNQIVTGKYARCVYLVFVFLMLIHWECNKIAENSYFSRNRQNWKEISHPCSQKCPILCREIKVHAIYPIFRA